MGTALEMQDPDNRLQEMDNYMESDKFSHREKLALRYTDVMMDDPTKADDELWAQLHEEFTERELVELGYNISWRIGGQRWIMTLHTQHGELEQAIGRPVLTSRTGIWG